ncbi:MAG TPA: AraC family transcriptional regulator [Leptolyngbyaceae cyanobacterium]
MKRSHEQAQVWRSAGLQNLEFMWATYINHSFPRHAHDTFGVGVVEQGCVETFQGGEFHKIPAGSIVLFNPEDVHACSAAHERGWTYRMFYPEENLIRQVASELAEGQGVPFFPCATVQDRDLANQILHLHIVSTEMNSNLEKESHLLSTLALLITRHARNQPSLSRASPEQQKLKQARDYLEAYYSSNITLKDLAKVAELEPLRLLRTFRKAFGLPPHQYLIQVRISSAKHALAKEMPIAEVAIATGFADQSHLTRHFKRLVGVTPKQYVLGCKNVQDKTF